MSGKKVSNYSYKHNQDAARKHGGRSSQKEQNTPMTQNKLTLYALPLGILLGLMLGFAIGVQEQDMMGGMRAGMIVGITIGAFLFAAGKLFASFKKKK